MVILNTQAHAYLDKFYKTILTTHNVLLNFLFCFKYFGCHLKPIKLGFLEK